MKKKCMVFVIFVLSTTFLVGCMNSFSKEEYAKDYDYVEKTYTQLNNGFFDEVTFKNYTECKKWLDSESDEILENAGTDKGKTACEKLIYLYKLVLENLNNQGVVGNIYDITFMMDKTFKDSSIIAARDDFLKAERELASASVK